MMSTTAPGDDTTADAAFSNRPGLEVMRADAETWTVAWEDGSKRSTTLVGLAWYAREHDPDATVTSVTNDE